MIRSRKISGGVLPPWLIETLHGASGGKYVVRTIEEDAKSRQLIWNDLKAYVDEAHEDAKKRLRDALAPSLAPFKQPTDDPAFGYPHDLHIVTLMGYMGEVLAAVIAEHTDLHGHRSWEVPLLLFRFHDLAFQRLEVRRSLVLQGGVPGHVDASSATLVGRGGSDVLAFRRTKDGDLDGIMVCEAKCLKVHNVRTLSDAHEQLSTPEKCPSGVRDLIDALQNHTDAKAQEWRTLLHGFRLAPPPNVTRVDTLVYATGTKPQLPKGRLAWASVLVPDPKYSGGRDLEVVEIYLDKPRDLVLSVYR